MPFPTLTIRRGSPGLEFERNRRDLTRVPGVQELLRRKDIPVGLTDYVHGLREDTPDGRFEKYLNQQLTGTAPRPAVQTIDPDPEQNIEISLTDEDFEGMREPEGYPQSVADHVAQRRSQILNAVQRDMTKPKYERLGGVLVENRKGLYYPVEAPEEAEDEGPAAQYIADIREANASGGMAPSTVQPSNPMEEKLHEFVESYGGGFITSEDGSVLLQNANGRMKDLDEFEGESDVAAFMAEGEQVFGLRQRLTQDGAAKALFTWGPEDLEAGLGEIVNVRRGQLLRQGVPPEAIDEAMLQDPVVVTWMQRVEQGRQERREAQQHYYEQMQDEQAQQEKAEKEFYSQQQKAMGYLKDQVAAGQEAYMGLKEALGPKAAQILQNYLETGEIKKRGSFGFDVGELEKALAVQGWTLEDVEEAYNELREQEMALEGATQDMYQRSGLMGQQTSQGPQSAMQMDDAALQASLARDDAEIAELAREIEELKKLAEKQSKNAK